MLLKFVFVCWYIHGCGDMFVSLVISKESGFVSCSNDFWTAVAAAIKRHNVSFLGGDFNMALFDTQFQMRKHRIDATFLGSYVWLDQNTRGGGATDQLQDCRYDSLGLFAVTAVSSVQRFLVPDELRKDDKEKLQTFVEGQGYPATSYMGGQRAIGAAFTITHGGGDPESMPRIKQKVISAQNWDKPNILFASGAHMPLLFYVGGRSHRCEKRLEGRDHNMAARGWGPSSANSRRLMERSKATDKGNGKSTCAVAAASAPVAGQTGPSAPVAGQTGA